MNKCGKYTMYIIHICTESLHNYRNPTENTAQEGKRPRRQVKNKHVYFKSSGASFMASMVFTCLLFSTGKIGFIRFKVIVHKTHFNLFAKFSELCEFE